MNLTNSGSDDSIQNTDGQTSATHQTSQTNGIEIPNLSLPNGGGAIKGIDEKFEVNPSNGTMTLSLEVPVTPGRNGFTPALGLSYDSGAGNGPFGLGWQLDRSSIRRKTDKILPRYRNDTEDVFLITGAEDLVPFLTEAAPGNWQVDEKTEAGYHVKRYRPRTAGLFSKIEKITHADHPSYWKVTNMENVVTLFGRSPEARIADPADASRIFEWMAEFSYDDKGNWIKYTYKEENLDSVPEIASEQHRLNQTEAITNRYLKKVSYGNHQPYYADPDRPYDPTDPTSNPDAIEAAHFFDVVLDYGDHHPTQPTIDEEPGQLWNYRSDAFSSYRSGFEIRTSRLCQRILMFHRFSELGPEPCLVKALELNYRASGINGSGQSEVTYLQSGTLTGYIRKEDGTYASRSLPPVEYQYQELNWNTEIREVSPQQLANAPVGITNNYQWADLYGEGISGIFSEQAEGWYYKENLGDPEATGVQFTPARQVAPKPSFTGMGDRLLSLEDLDANGEKQVVVKSDRMQGYFDLGTGSFPHQTPDTNKWDPKTFTAFKTVPNVDWGDENLRLIDLNGDGRPEVVISENNAFVWYPNKGKEGYDAFRRSVFLWDENKGPSTIFSNGQERIFLTDITGDGLTDIVRVRNGEVCYWANKGYGKFSAKVSMNNPPTFDHPDHFNTRYIHFSDISGTGANDLIYLGKNQFNAYLNLSGNAWSNAHRIDPFMEVHPNGNFSVTDFLGNGTGAIVWSSDLPGEAPIRYIDLMQGKKPHVLIAYQNNFGKKVTAVYKSSTHFYLKDKREGNPWVTKLPFPVQVVEKLITEDATTGIRFTTQYRYRHGYYDHAEREFRGFGRVDQTDTETYDRWRLNAGELEKDEVHYQKPVLTRSWYHTGAGTTNGHLSELYEKEFWYNERAKQGYPASATEYLLPGTRLHAAANIQDPQVLAKLSAPEHREAIRACKGNLLRQEVFALDAPENPTDEARIRELTPYSVTLHSCKTQLLQPRNDALHAVFLSTASEQLVYHYERNDADPRRVHELMIKTNEWGQNEESVSVVYGRVLVDPELPPNIQQLQARERISFRQQIPTNSIDTAHTYRLPQVGESLQYECADVARTTAYYQVSDFENLLANGNEVEHHVSLYAAPDPFPGLPKIRKLEHAHTLFYLEDLSGPAAPGVLASAIQYENYQLAFTPALLQHIYGAKMANPQGTLLQAGYTHFAGDQNWWTRSGVLHFMNANDGETLANAQQRFYSPVQYEDAFGALKRVKYYKDYFLQIQETEDAYQNITNVEEFDFRSLQPVKLRDSNANLSEAMLDELGMVKSFALLGKDLDGDGSPELELADSLQGIPVLTDAEQPTIQAFFQSEDSEVLNQHAATLLGRATKRFVYDLHTFVNNGRPVASATIQRETHHHQLLPEETSALQLSFSYRSGMGNVVMKKVQAEPGVAKKAIIHPDDTVEVTEVDTRTQIPQRLRWIGNGRTVWNNKGKPVRKYEPYFSVTPHYESLPELVETGVTPILFYDPVGRMVKTLLPDGTLTRKRFSPWYEQTFDQNDTVGESQWYADRGSPDPDLAEPADPQQRAAWLTARHHLTPYTKHLDALGQPVYQISHFRNDAHADVFVSNTTETDVQGRVVKITDDRQNIVMQYRYDMLGTEVYQEGMDAGTHWILHHVLQKPIISWDSRGHIVTQTYDALQRPLETHVAGGDGEAPLDHLVQKLIYGENIADAAQLNLRGVVHRHYDTAGRKTASYDFKGNTTHISRQLTTDYKNTVNWNEADSESLLESEVFTQQMTYDALNRTLSRTASDASTTVLTYNAAQLPEQITVERNGVTDTILASAAYNEKRMRTQVVYGNQVKTDYTYDSFNFRLTSMVSVNGANALLKEIHYVYDPVGNTVETEDKSIPTVFFGNHQMLPKNKYSFDALYRLRKAEGREHAGQQMDFGSDDNVGDLPFMQLYQANDVMAWRNYLREYRYDTVGNLLQMKHTTHDPLKNWTRDYAYEANNNRLVSNAVGGQVYHYTHHPEHGFLTALPHLSVMRWNFKDELQAIARQKVVSGTPETTYYTYDSEGKRVRKVTENQTAEGAEAIRKEERIYLGDLEIYRKHSGTNQGLERTSLHLLDQGRRIAMIDTRNGVNDGTDAKTIRYQLDNHQHSALMELDHTGAVINYEEYHPFGTTAYQAVNKAIKAAAKRYRYTGMERDEESGLAYHTARYYIPWLGRWLSPDPAGLADGNNLYRYARNNPLKFTDPNGTDPPEDDGGTDDAAPTDGGGGSDFQLRLPGRQTGSVFGLQPLRLGPTLSPLSLSPSGPVPAPSLPSGPVQGPQPSTVSPPAPPPIQINTHWARFWRAWREGSDIWANTNQGAGTLWLRQQQLEAEHNLRVLTLLAGGTLPEFDATIIPTTLWEATSATLTRSGQMGELEEWGKGIYERHSTLILSTGIPTGVGLLTTGALLGGLNNDWKMLSILNEGLSLVPEIELGSDRHHLLIGTGPNLISYPGTLRLGFQIGYKIRLFQVPGISGDLTISTTSQFNVPDTSADDSDTPSATPAVPPRMPDAVRHIPMGNGSFFSIQGMGQLQLSF